MATFVQFSTNTKAIEIKWVYKLKHNPNRSVAKHKSMLVAKGFLQRIGLDYSKVYAPIASIIRTCITHILVQWTW